MDVRKASTKISGEMGDGVEGGSSRSGKIRSGFGGPNGDGAGKAKSISKGDRFPRDSWGTEL
jgi:hypothetical protein